MAQTKPKTKSAKGKTGAAKKSVPRKKSVQAKPLIRREVWAGLDLFAAFVGVLSGFGVQGFLIRWYDRAFYALLGYGCVLLPFAFIASGVLLILKRKGKARLRVSCILALPVLFGALRHLLSSTGSYAATMAGIQALAGDGIRQASGGVLSGGFALLLRAAIGKVGACVLCCLLMAVCVAAAFRITPALIWKRAKALRLQPEPAEAPRTQEPVAGPRSGGIPLYDIPLEDQDVTQRRPLPREDALIPPPNVPTPAEALRGEFQADKEAARAQAQAAEVAQTAQRRSHLSETLHSVLGKKPPVPGVMAAPPPTPEEDALAAGAAVRQPAVTEIRRETEEPESPEVSEEMVAQEIRENLKQGGEDHPVYFYPPIHLLKPGTGRLAGSEEAIRQCAARLIDTLLSFGIEATVVDITSGPTVTRYELLLQRGIKFSRVTNLSDDIALALGAVGIRVSTIPDKNAVGVEVPNEQQELVTARDIIDTASFRNSKSRLSFAVGKNIAGEPVVGDIGKMPHMLIAGTTGSGKSVCINSILISLLYKSTPEEVRLIMVDPKMIELGVYNGIPHLLLPVVTDPKKAAGALNWAVGEMMRRYKLFAEVGARDLNGYNSEMERRQAAAAAQPQPQPEEASDPKKYEKLPRVVVVVDELSDLMAVARSEVEEAIIRIAQMARAAGMHLIIATQRPSADVITGLMKTNIPSRIAFAVASAIDSRIILDQMGAEKLLGKGDMLYAPLGGGKPMRVQGCFVTDQEVESVVSFVKERGSADYDEEVMAFIERQGESEPGTGGTATGGDGDEDPLLMDAIGIVVEGGQASVSMLQRRLKLGYSRAARLVDQMEERGIVGPFEGSKPRTVTITREEWQEMQLRRDSL